MFGYRNNFNSITEIARKTTEQVLQDAQTHVSSFGPAVALGRAHAILHALLKYFRGRGSSVSAQGIFVLRVNAVMNAKITLAASDSELSMTVG